MKIFPKPYYKCDYCEKTSENPKKFKYTDNSGLNSQCFDMCSDDCYDKHVTFLKNDIFPYPKAHNLNLEDYSLEEYLKDQISVNH